MPFLMLLGLLSLSFTAAAQPVRVEPPDRDAKASASAGASGDAARIRAGSGASVEGGAALGATGVNTRPAVKAEEAERNERRRARAKVEEKK